MAGTKNQVRIVNPPPTGILVTFLVPAGAPCTLTASAWYLTESPPALSPSTSVLYQQAALTVRTVAPCSIN